MTSYMPKAKSSEWGTPQWLFDELDEEYGFTLDVCASEQNAKCERYNTIQQPKLWTWTNETCWMNPPYGVALNEWMLRASTEPSCTVVALVPSRTDTRWWHEYVMQRAYEIRFVKGRLKFEGAKDAAPFPSAVITYVYNQMAGEEPPLIGSLEKP